MTARRILGEERGASLLMALAFLTFMGVFSVSILAFTGVGSTTSTIVAARADQRYAADAGMEYGIANLVADTTKCSTSGSAFTWPATTVNGRPTTYGCSWVSGGTALSGSPILGQYGTIITGTGRITYNTYTSISGVSSFAYDGSVHSVGGASFADPTDQLMAVDGNLTVVGACPPARVTFTSPGACTGGAAIPTLPTISVYVPSAEPPLVPWRNWNGSAWCTTLYPGRYGPGLNEQSIPSFDPYEQYYFASGVYYINGGTMTLRGTVFGGQKSASEVQKLTGVAPCRPSDPAIAGVSGTGVTFVLGGSATISVGNYDDAKVELFSRVPPVSGTGSGATPGVTIWAGTGSSVISGSGTYTSSATSTYAFSTTWPTQDVVLHGLTYVPSATTGSAFLNNFHAGGSSVFMGGLVTSGLDIFTIDGDGGKTMNVSGTGGFSSTPRVVTLTSTATGSAGAAETRITAEVELAATLIVRKWRVT